MKKFLKFLTFSVVGIFVFLFLFVLYLRSDFNSGIDQDSVHKIVEEIKSSKQLPSKFIKVFNEVEPTTSTVGILWDWSINGGRRICPCQSLSRMYIIPGIRNGITSNIYVFSMQLEKHVSQDECLSFMLFKKFDFLYNNIGLDRAADYYFDSTVDDLNEKQIKAFAWMTRNPSLYNPKRFPDRIEEKLKEN